MTAFDKSSMEGLARAFWGEQGEDGSSLICLRFGQNGVFHDPTANLVLRIHRPSRSFDQVCQELRLADHLASRGFPATRLAKRFNSQPYQYGGFNVSIWEFVEKDGRIPDYFDLAVLVRQFHAATADYADGLGPVPWAELSYARLERFAGLDVFDANTLGLLLERVTYLKTSLSHGVSTVLGEGVLHGDAHLGNVISTSDGLVLTDFERISYGAREWDAVPTLVALRRFGDNDQHIARFAQGFGGGVLGHPLFDEMSELREYFMLTHLMELKGTSLAIDTSIELQTRTLINRDRFAKWEAHW